MDKNGKRKSSYRLILVILLIGLITVLAACGGSDEEPTVEQAAAPTEAPTATEAPAEPTPTEAAPEPTEEPEATAEPAEEAVEPAPTEEPAEETPEEVDASNPDPVAEDSDAPAVELPPADAEGATGTVTAENGVNVRAGPGTDYEVLGMAPQGTEGEIIGVSEDGEWWVASAPALADGQGWVSAAYIEAINADDVPVVPAPALPEAGTKTEETQTTVPDSPGSASLLIYSASRVVQDGNTVNELQDVYMAEPSPGSAATLVIENAMQPALQPGGANVAFRSTQSDQLGLSGYDFDTDTRVRYSKFAEDSRPRWSPTGDRMVFSSDREGDRAWRLYITEPIAGEASSDFVAAELGRGKDPDWHPTEELIVFNGCDETANNCGLWTLNSDGANRTPLTDVASDLAPRWSPDGAWVVFMSDQRDGNWELYSLSIADGTVTRLTENEASDGIPAVSPDGQKIAFMSNRDGAWGIWTMPAAGGDAQLITQVAGDLPDWLIQAIDWSSLAPAQAVQGDTPPVALPTPTPAPVLTQLSPNSLILFSASRVIQEGNSSFTQEDTYTTRAVPGTQATLAIENAMQPALQPDGATVAFRSTQTDRFGLGGYDFDTGTRVRYSSFVEDSRPRWSPTGDRMVFSSDREGDRAWRLYITEPITGESASDFTASELGFGKDADWHPNEELLVFKGCDDTGNSCGLWTIRTDGSERSPLTDGANDSLPRWSPDGASVVFMSDQRDGNWELYSLNVADGAITRLTDDPEPDGIPAVSPDGAQIAFISKRGGSWGLWTIPAAGGDATLITVIDSELPNWLTQGTDWPR